MNCRNISLFMCMVQLAFSEKNPDPSPDPLIDIDQIVDTAMSTVLSDEKFNPLILRKKYVVPINQNIGIIPVTGELKIAHGELSGLQSIVRSGHCEIHYNDLGSASVDVPLANNGSALVLEADVSGHLNPLPTIMAIPIEARVGRMAVEVSIIMSIDRKLSLKEFHVDDINDVQIRWQESVNIPFAGKILDILTKAFIYIFNNKIKSVIEKTCTPILAEELENFPIPI